MENIKTLEWNLLDNVKQNSNDVTCQTNNDLSASLYWRFIVYFVVSFCVLVIFSLLEKRNKLFLNWCFSRPGLPVPMNFLIEPAFRFPYVIVFGVLALDIPHIVQEVGGSTPSFVDKIIYLDVLYSILIIPLLVVVITGIKYFPLLACVEANYLFTGHCIGLFSSFLWFSLILYETVRDYYNRVCLRGLNPWDISIVMLQHIPILFASASVMMWYLYKVVSEIIAYTKGHNIRVIKGKHHLLHVKQLVSGDSHKRHGKCAALLLKIVEYFVPYKNYIRFPLPFICAITAVAAILYQLCILSIILTSAAADGISNAVSDILPLLNVSSDIEEAVQVFIIGAPTFLSIVPIVALLICIVSFLQMMSSVRDVLKKATKHGFSGKMPSKISRLQKAWEFVGLQIGLGLWAWIIYYIILLTACVVLGLLISLLGLGLVFFKKSFINSVIVLVASLIWSKVVTYSQYLAAKYIFYKDSTGNFISITNQRLFDWFSYVLFIYNGFVGVVEAILRIVLSTAVSVLFIFRLDKMILPSGFEAFDSGHKAFLSFFSIYGHYNNPVVHTFVYLMRRSAADWKERRINAHRLKSNDISGGIKRRRVCNRWLVAYTLLRNSSIQGLTASNLATEKSTESLSSQEEKHQLEIEVPTNNSTEIYQNHVELFLTEDKITEC